MIPQPSYLGGVQFLGDLPYSRYRLFIIACSVVLAVVLFLLHRKTRIGALIRAGVDDREMVGALGVNIPRVFTAAFGFGTALAGIGGVVAGAVLGLQPGEEADILLLSLAVVIIGGVGRLGGTVLGCLLVGFATVFGRTYVPELSYFILFGPMALILVFRPRGLLGRA
jgi:branched-chain amino acid transport system permease protein